MTCRKCKKEIPDESAFCLHCGSEQAVKTYRRTRSNGMGTAYKRGKTWTASVVVAWREEEPQDGKEHLLPIKRTKGGFKTKKDALEYCAVLRGLPAKTKNAGITFAKLYEQWKPYYEPRISASTMKCHVSAYKWFKPIWYYAFSDICAADLQNCIEACTVGKRTKENMKSLAMGLYKYAGANKIVEHNYAQYIYCGNDEQATRPPFTADEIEKIRQAIGKAPCAEYVYCMIYTGFRPNEMLSLTVDAYDAAHKTLTGGFKTEAGRNRTVTLSPKVEPIIAQLTKGKMPSAYIFPRKDGKRMSDKYFRDEYFYPLMAALGIKDRVPYSCRHTFANLMKNVQGSDTDKAALIGHADASMTKYYQSPDYESLRAITDKI
jgi:integrase